jgi:hypothetical protein
MAGTSSIRRAIAWLSMSRSRSAAIASATAARCSATASRERSSSNSSLNASEGASLPPVRGCTGLSGVRGGVVGGMRPAAMRAVIGILHPCGVETAPSSPSSSRLRRSVETETPHAFAAAARPSTGPPLGGLVVPVTASAGGVTLEGVDMVHSVVLGTR